MDPVFIIGIFLAFFFSVLLFTKRDKTLSDTVLAVWLSVIGIYLLNYYVYHQGYWERYPHLVGLLHPFPLLFGPFLYLYVSLSLRKEQQFGWRDMLHFLPFLFLYLAMLPFYFGYSAAEKIRVDQLDTGSEFRVIMMISLVAFILSGAIYTVLSYRKIGKYEQLITHNFAYAGKISLKWLRFMILGLAVIVGVVGLLYALQEGVGLAFGFNIDLIFFVLIVLSIFLFGYFGIRYQGIFSEHSQVGNEIVEPRTNGEYKKSGLKPQEALALREKLHEVMAIRKPYLEPKLTLSDLATELATTPNNLSQVINQYEEKNFYDFVNEYRVKEFIKKASQPENRNLNLLGIAFESGFNSKSSFNEVFKKQTGLPPSKYLKSNANKESA